MLIIRDENNIKVDKNVCLMLVQYMKSEVDICMLAILKNLSTFCCHKITSNY